MNDRTMRLMARMRKVVVDLTDDTDGLQEMLDSDSEMTGKEACELALMHLSDIRVGFAKVDGMLDELRSTPDVNGGDVDEMKKVIGTMRSDAMTFIDSVLDLYSVAIKAEEGKRNEETTDNAAAARGTVRRARRRPKA